MCPHKKQHFVAQFYLSRFALRRGQLAVFDKAQNRVFWGRPVDIGHENHFLSLPELDGEAGSGAFFESLFGSTEEAAAAGITDTLERIQCGIRAVVTEESRNAIALFLTLQHLRTRAARDRMLQMRDAMDRAMRELRKEGSHELKRWIDEGLRSPRDTVREHAEYILNPEVVAKLATVLCEHVWLIFAASGDTPFYTSDHPLALHSHVPSEVRGFGPASFGTELQFAFGPRYLLSLVERRWLGQSTPSLVHVDGQLAGTLKSEHVMFQRSLQVRDSRRFVYSSTDDFDLAREMCEAEPDLRDTDRKRVKVIYAGRSL